MNDIIFYSIDRFEEDFAICENLNTQEIVNIKKENLPHNCKEGSIIKFKNGKYILDYKKTQSHQKRIKKIVDNLFKDN